jgi:hypothetical protein
MGGLNTAVGVLSSWTTMNIALFIYHFTYMDIIIAKMGV